MTLQDLMNETHGKEITVHDTNYDMEAYFYGRSDWEPEKEWQEENKAKQTLSSLLDIEDLDIDTDKENITATVNLSGLIERNLDKLEQEDLFINPDINAIMDDMQNILTGYVSEEWFEKFANALATGDERYIEERIRVPEPEISLPEKPRSNDEPER